MADEKIIFSMNGVSKILPHNNKVILKDIYLSFFYGAKIGIIGLNGSGKSTLLKIIAGVEKSYKGEVVWAPGYSVGYLEQEPQMDPDKTVLEVVQDVARVPDGARAPVQSENFHALSSASLLNTCPSRPRPVRSGMWVISTEWCYHEQ